MTRNARILVPAIAALGAVAVFAPATATADPPEMWVVHCAYASAEKTYGAATPEQLRENVAYCKTTGGHVSGITVHR